MRMPMGRIFRGRVVTVRALASSLIMLAAGLGAGAALLAEFKSSWLQSELLSSFARELTYGLDAGPADAPVGADEEPHSQRLGYAGIGGFANRLQDRGFALTQQARLSARHRQFVALGGFRSSRRRTRRG
jgi:hypothetical protein